MIRRTLQTMTAVAALGLAACATQPGPATLEDGMERGVIVVDNTTSTVASATIYMVPEDGVADRLGAVNMNEEKRFAVMPALENRYRLRADVGDDELFSRYFTFMEGNVIEWDLATNNVTFVADVSGS